MAGWTIHVCPKCHAQGQEGGDCPNGCRKKSGEAAIGEPTLKCIAVQVDPTYLGTVALINASAKL